MLRHFVADPLLPRELLPRRWPGDALRADYDRYDRRTAVLLARWNEVGPTGVDPDVAAATVDVRERT